MTNSATFVRHDCKNLDERENSPYTYASLTCGQRTILSTEDCCSRYSLASAYQPRFVHLFANPTTACGLACVQMMASTHNRFVLPRGCDKAACCRCCDSRCCSTCQRGRRHSKGFSAPRGRCGGRKRGAIGMSAKGNAEYAVRR